MAYSPHDITIPFHMDIPVQAQQYLRDLVTWRPPDSLVNVMGLVGFIALLYLIGWWLNKPKTIRMGEDDMVKHFRNARVRFIVGEGITEFVEEAVFKEKLTRAESIDIYTKIGRMFGLVDLLPKKKPRLKLSRGETEHLKEQIKDRIKKQTTDNVVEITEKKLGKMLKR